MSLYNPGFLGAQFNWWIGQIADDSTWRDNILPGKFENKDTISGWGRRYKVRIIGLHDQDENSLKSEELPWAQVMYPVTGGGGQTNAGATANLRQGMFVFGFFLDGQDQQVPVIMGVLGNNAQTPMLTKTALTGGKNFAAQSGYADSKEPKKGSSKEIVPDEGLVTVGLPAECAPAPPGAKLDKYGLRYGQITKEQLQDIQSASREATLKNLTGAAFDEFVKNAVQNGIKNRCQQAGSPASGPIKNPTKEDVDAVHRLSKADVVREELYQEKIPLMKPDDKVGSAIKGIQTVLDNVLKKIDKYLNAALSYIDAVSNVIDNIQNIISNAACEIAKYMKLIFDKIMEYVLKTLNKELTNVVSAIPSSMRYMFGDMKEIITELILCLYNKLTGKLCGLIQGLLDELLNLDDAKEKIKNKEKDKRKTKPDVPTCSAEEFVGRIIASTKTEIDTANNTILDNINSFLEDIQSQLAGVSGALSNITSLLGNIDGSLTSALNFENIALNIFGCELKPNVAVSDFYTFARGGAAQPDAETPSAKSIENTVSKDPAPIQPSQDLPYVQPTPNTENVVNTPSISSAFTQPTPNTEPLGNSPSTSTQQTLNGERPILESRRISGTLTDEQKTNYEKSGYRVINTRDGSGAILRDSRLE